MITFFVKQNVFISDLEVLSNGSADVVDEFSVSLSLVSLVYTHASYVVESLVYAADYLD